MRSAWLKISVLAFLVGACLSCGRGVKEYLRLDGIPGGTTKLAVFPSRVNCGYMEEDGFLVCERCQCDGYKTGLLIKAEAELLAAGIEVDYYHRPDLDARVLGNKIWKAIRDDKVVVEDTVELAEMSGAEVILLSSVFCWKRTEKSAINARGSSESYTVRSGKKPGKPVKVRDEVGLDLVLFDGKSGEMIWRHRRKQHADNKQRTGRHTHVYESATEYITKMMEDFPLRSTVTEEGTSVGDETPPDDTGDKE